MKIPDDVLHRMLEPGTVIVREEFRCRCSTWTTRVVPGTECIRAATEEDGLCDGCRDHCGKYTQHGPLWVGDIETRGLVAPADTIWPPVHTCLIPLGRAS